MDRRFLTLFVLTNDTAKPRQLKIPFRILKIAGVASAVFTLVMGVMLFDYARLKMNSFAFGSYADQKLALQGFAEKIKELDSQVARLNLFDRKLRIIANIEGEPKPAGAPEQVLGIGGDSLVDDDLFSKPGAKVEELVDEMRSDLLNLEHQASGQEESFKELTSFLVNKSVKLASTPSVWPAKGWVTSRFGGRISPFTGHPQHHSGIDIANRIGTPVAAPAAGVVVKAGRDSGLGNMIEISHGYGIKTTFGHLEQTFVRVGQRIKRGEKIGAMGNTGRSTGPHLHYSVAVNGVSVNPEKYILD